jgi:hypothetical protein
MATPVALVQVFTHRGRAALHDMPHHLLLGGTRRICAAIGLRMCAEMSAISQGGRGSTGWLTVGSTENGAVRCN